MKTYPIIDWTGDVYLNPVPAIYNNGTHIRNINQITSISIHHSAVTREHDYNDRTLAYAEAAEHYQRLGPGLQYAYKISNLGDIYHIRPLTTWLYAVGSTENVTTLPICLDGNFETQEPTKEQFEALYQLLENLCENHPEFPATWPDVRPHADYSATACCGANLRNRIYAIQDKASAQAQLLNQGVYDWPTLQPSATPVPATPLAAAPAATPVPVTVVQPIAPDSTPVVLPPVPVTPPTPTIAAQSHDYSAENNGLLKQILALVQWIKDKISSVWK